MRKNIEAIASGGAAAGNLEMSERIEAIARTAYDRCHPDDTFEDLKRRALFSKEDGGLLRDWLAYATREAGGGRTSQ